MPKSSQGPPDRPDGFTTGDQNRKTRRSDVYILLTVAGLAMWNMGVTHLAGFVLYYGVEKKILKF